VQVAAGLRNYVWNCIWLILPPMLILAIVSPLPQAYRADLFWKDIPGWVGTGENLTRAIIVAFPAFMPLRIVSPTQRIGLALYVLGLGMYWVAWRSPLWFAGSAWVSHPAVFMVPAWTPAIWLAGISLIGDRFYFSIPYRPWMYTAASVVFLMFHNLHAWIVWARTH
jgi:hypothetical protein